MNQLRSVCLEKCGFFKNQDCIELSPLTVLTGLNGSGKTTILKEIASQYDNVKCYKWLGISFFTEGIESNENDILLFEQPEVGLHPQMQLILADALLSLANCGRIIVVETHSDHMLNRWCRRYMENVNIRDKIRIYFLEREVSLIKKASSEIVSIPIDPINGAICENENFFYQFASETEKIIDAGYKNLQKNSIEKDNIQTSDIKQIEIDECKGIINASKNFFTQFGFETMEIAKVGYENYRKKAF